jgi:hypothetical protein
MEKRFRDAEDKMIELLNILQMEIDKGNITENFAFDIIDESVFLISKKIIEKVLK